jgi:hypothetical protein
MSFEKIPDEFKITPYYSNSYLIDGELKEWERSYYGSVLCD